MRVNKKKKSPGLNKRFGILLLLYLLVGLFPGFLFSHMLRLATFSSEVLIVFAGILLVLLPFVLLALFLTHFLRNAILLPHPDYIIYGIGISGFSILLIIITVVESIQIALILDGRSINTSPSKAFGLHFLITWLMAYLAGLGIFLSRTYQLADKPFEKPKKTVNQMFK